MIGTFTITCALRSDGTTGIQTQDVSAPWHLSKPYWTGRVLLVQAVNATAGIFAGDRLECRVTVEEGASVLMTAPSANRIHTMSSGEAVLKQYVAVKTGGWLEWMPELFIPQRGCRYRQFTELQIDAGAGAYFVETLAPGRVAHGEVFAFDTLSWTTRIHYHGELVLAEHYPMTPQDQSLHDLRHAMAPRYFASALLVHPAPLPFRDWQKQLATAPTPDTRIGGTRLAEHVYLFRVLAGSSESLKETLRSLRAMIASAIPVLHESARKL